ncbi:MAG: hypothetical protein ACKOQW_02465 [Phycisphaerales bacterium]
MVPASQVQAVSRSQYLEFPVMRISNRLEKHAIAASVVALGATAAANAAVVAWTNCNLVIPNNIDGLYINVETRVTGSAGNVVAGWDINPYSASALNWFNATGTGMLRFPGVTTGSAGSLAIGTVVGASGSYGSGAVTVGSAPGNWQLNAVNYFGFRFVAADGGTKYGYGTFAIGSSITGADRTITNLYYEDSGASITVVPAPGAIALLGLAGFAGRRRR